MDYRERWELKEYQSEQRLGRRATLLHAVIIVVLVAFVGVFWYLQVVKGSEFALLAENNRLRRIALPPTRGVVLDRKDEVLASTRPALNLVLVRDGLTDAEGQLKRLEGFLGIPYDTLNSRLQAMRHRPTFEPLVIKEDVQLSDIAKVEARREWFPSVEIEQTALRDYPDGPARRRVRGRGERIAAGEDRGRLAPARGHRRQDRSRARVRRDPAGSSRLEASDRQQPRPALRRVAAGP
jgi:penicillin-binding protein 2